MEKLDDYRYHRRRGHKAPPGGGGGVAASSFERSTMKRPETSTLRDFDELPVSAHVRLPFVAALLSISPSTVWRWSRTGRLPKPVRIGGVTLWNVGELRNALRGLTAADV